MTVTFSTDSMMRTAHGWVSLSDPQPHQIHIDDIQTALFNIHRFTGHSSISVLDHSCRAYLFASYEMGIEDPRQLLTVLLHDAQEAYVGDLSSPIKAMLREHTTVYDVIEQRFADVIARKWDLDGRAASGLAMEARRSCRSSPQAETSSGPHKCSTSAARARWSASLT